MSQTLKSVQEFYDEAPPTDITEIFGTWMELVDGLKAKVADRFDLPATPPRDVLESFGGENGGPDRPDPRLRRPGDRLDGALPHGERHAWASPTSTSPSGSARR